MLREIFVPKTLKRMEKKIRKQFVNFYSPAIIWMKKVKFMRKCRSSTHEDVKKIFRYSGGNPKGKSVLGTKV